MFERELNGVADMMRWEILHAMGGIVVDADSIALKPLSDDLLDCEAFACWENEIARPGLIAAGYFGCEAGNALVEQIIHDIHDEPTVTHDMAWKTVGPLRLMSSGRGDPRKAIVDAIEEVRWLREEPGKTFYAVGGAWRAFARLHMEQAGLLSQR